MNPIISISGARGIIDESFSSEEVLRLSQAFGSFMPEKAVIAIARDTRVTGEMLKLAAISGLLSAGCDVVDLDIVPTPTLQFYVRKMKIDGGIIVTASHNPIQWNALKFYKKSGQLFNYKDIEKLKKIYFSREFKIRIYKNIGTYRQDDSACDIHIYGVIKNLYNLQKIKKRRFKVVIDSCNGAGSYITPKFLKLLNCDVTELYTKPDGYFPRGAEPLSANLKDLSKTVKKVRADIGFAQDPDADRLAIVDEKGIPIGEEFTLAFAARYVLKKTKGPVVANLSTSKMIEDVAIEMNVPIYRTPVGEMNVSNKMQAIKSPIGGEGNGGVIYPVVNYGRDSLVGIGLVLCMLAEEGRSVSELARTYKKYYMIKEKAKKVKNKDKQILQYFRKNHKIKKIDERDGLYIKTEFLWVHVRPSNTEPIYRIIIEGEDKGQVKKIVNDLKNLMK